MSAVQFTDVLASHPREGWPGALSFSIAEGSFALVVAAPGVALTLIRLIAGLREPASGTVAVLGVHPGRLNRWETQRFRRRLGVGLAEPSGLVSNLTLHMNLVVPMLYSGLAGSDEAHARAAAIIGTFGLGRWAGSRPADVPPEVRREAVVARALVREPELLVLEEPTSGLGDRRAGWVLSRCREHARTIVTTTAEQESVQYERADTILTIHTSGIEIVNHEVGAL